MLLRPQGLVFLTLTLKASYSMNSSHFLCSVHVLWLISITLISLGFQSTFVEIFNWLRILCMPIICSDPHPSPPIPPWSNSLVFLLNFLWSLFKSAESTKGYQYVHGCRTIYWSVNSLPGTAFLKKMGSFSTNSCQLPITPQVGVEHHEHFVWHLVHVITATRNL